MTARRVPRLNAPAADTRQLCLLAPDAAVIIHLVRENLRLLHELVTRFEVGRVVYPDPSEGERDQVEIRGPAGIVRLLEAEMAPLQQEQLRVVLLDTRNRVLGTSLVYQGGLNTTAIASLADFFREAVRAGAHALVLVHNHPSGAPRSV